MFFVLLHATVVIVDLVKRGKWSRELYAYSLWVLLSGSVKFDFVLSNPATSDQ